MSVGLVWGIPHLETRPPCMDWAFAFKSLNPPINYNVVFSSVRNQPVDRARNLIVAEALKQNAKYVFFHGDDVIVPPHTLRQLIFRMEQDADVAVVGGVYCSKCEPPSPLVFRGNGAGCYWDWKIGEYFEVTGLGMDCTLIRCEVFKDLSEPYFKTVDKDDFLDGVNNAEMWTEDLYFLHQILEFKKKEAARQWKIMCDASIICQHVDVHNGKYYSLPSYSLPTRRFQNEGKKIVDLGCGPIRREFEEGIPVRVDLDERWEPDYRCDVRSLPFENGEFDIVFSSHVLEHLPRAQTRSTLAEWVRLVKPDGELRLILPNLEWAAKQVVESNGTYKEDDPNIHHRMNVFYGAQSSPYDFHQTGFTPASIKHELTLLGLEVSSFREEGYNMFINARRSAPLEPTTSA